MREPKAFWPLRLLWRVIAAAVFAVVGFAIFWYVSGMLVFAVLNPLLKLDIADYAVGQATLSDHLEILAAGALTALAVGAGFAMWQAALNRYERARWTWRLGVEERERIERSRRGSCAGIEDADDAWEP